MVYKKKIILDLSIKSVEFDSNKIFDLIEKYLSIYNDIFRSEAPL